MAHASQETESIARRAEALLREHPDALVAGLASNGLITPVPTTIGLWGQELIPGRAVIDHVLAEDRNTVARMWVALHDEGAVAGKVRLLRKPSTWATLHFLDVRAIHGIVLAVVLPSDESVEATGEPEETVRASPRFCWLMEDESARVLDCDDAFTEMFGYTAEELLGNSVLDQIHPEDQGRAVEGWLSVLATRRNQQTRLRRRRKDGSWVWVDTTLHNYLNEPSKNYVLVEIIDASAEMAAQEALQEREELLRRLADAMPVGLLHQDTGGRVLYSNARLREILQGSSGAVSVQAAPEEDASSVESPATPSPSARVLLQALTEEGMAAFDSALGEVLAEGVDRDIEADLVDESGQWRRVMMSLRVLMRQNGEVSGAITCVLDVTDSARAREELEVRASYDALTNCRNRSSIMNAVELELAREDQSTTCVVYVDLDGFKPVNDRLGHAAGDELLVVVAERLRSACRGADEVGRIGGDEFLVLLRDVSHTDTAMAVAERICESLHRPFELACGTVDLGASVGVACASAGATTGYELIRRSDSAMYAAKERGNRTAVLAVAKD